MVVVLVDLFVNGSLDLLVTVLLDGLLGHSWCNDLMDGSVVVSGLGPEKCVRRSPQSAHSNQNGGWRGKRGRQDLT